MCVCIYIFMYVCIHNMCDNTRGCHFQLARYRVWFCQSMALRVPEPACTRWWLPWGHMLGSQWTATVWIETPRILSNSESIQTSTGLLQHWDQLKKSEVEQPEFTELAEEINTLLGLRSPPEHPCLSLQQNSAVILPRRRFLFHFGISTLEDGETLVQSSELIFEMSLKILNILNIWNTFQEIPSSRASGARTWRGLSRACARASKEQAPNGLDEGHDGAGGYPNGHGMNGKDRPRKLSTEGLMFNMRGDLRQCEGHRTTRVRSWFPCLLGQKMAHWCVALARVWPSDKKPPFKLSIAGSQYLKDPESDTW